MKHHKWEVWRKSVFDIYFTELGAALTTVLPVLFKYCYKYCNSDSRKLWAVMKGGGLAFKIWFNPPFLLKCLYQIRVITVFTVFRLLTDFVCLYTYEFWLSLCKIVWSSVILLLPLFMRTSDWYKIMVLLLTGKTTIRSYPQGEIGFNSWNYDDNLDWSYDP
jgi:hypothetical protein